jgi:hypothetical protein
MIWATRVTAIRLDPGLNQGVKNSSWKFDTVTNSSSSINELAVPSFDGIVAASGLEARLPGGGRF